MCGRTACTLGPDEVCQSCSTVSVDGSGKKRYKAAEWRDHPGNHSYIPSHNMAPSRFTPVMISAHHIRGVKRANEDDGNLPSVQHVIQPMMWGLIPPFYKGSSANGHGFKTNNCRIEDIEEKKSYKPSLVKGQRCVVLCDGFYEWQSTKGDKNKQPHFIFAPQTEGVDIWNRKTWDTENVWSEEEGWKGPQLLKLAGLFSRWTSTEGEEVMSYTIVTMESGKNFASLHHRVPAILETDEDVEEWLNSGTIGYKEALGKLRRDTELNWHPVSTAVNNSRNQDPDLNHSISLDKKPSETASSKLMSAWLTKGSQNPSKESPRADQKQKKTSMLDNWLKKDESSSSEKK